MEAVLIRCAGVGWDSVVEAADDYEELPEGWLRIHEVGDREVACCSTVCVASWAAAGGCSMSPSWVSTTTGCQTCGRTTGDGRA